MRVICWIGVIAVVGLWASRNLNAQEAGSGELNMDSIRQSGDKIVDDARDKVTDIARQVDQSAQAKDVSAGILQPIYALAEAMSFPLFHWTAFTLMMAGVVSFAFQLVLGKLVVLSKMSIDLKEILADALGLAISLIGLVLTTQAAAQNSTFTESPAAVLSAAVIGVIVGLIFYRWGQREEVQAALGRKLETKADD